MIVAMHQQYQLGRKKARSSSIGFIKGLVFGLLLVLFCGIGVGCKKIDVSEIDRPKRSGLWFFNYTIQNTVRTVGAVSFASPEDEVGFVPPFAGETLRVLVCADYFPPEIFDRFQARFGAKVEVKTAESAKEMLALLKAGGGVWVDHAGQSGGAAVDHRGETRGDQPRECA